jgi:hypothetical protein
MEAEANAAILRAMSVHERPARPAPLRLAAPLAALLAVSCSSGTAPDPAPAPLAEFDAERAWRDLTHFVELGPRPAGSLALDELRAHVAAELEAAGLEPDLEQFTADTPAGPIEFVNLWTEVPGRGEADAPLPVIAIGAHIDTKRLPFHFVGANDAGSGTAALLELARALAARAGERPVTYRLVFLDGEESVREEWAGDDNLYGSRHHVRLLRDSGEIERIRAFVLLDMVADRDLRLTTDLNSDRELRSIFESAARSEGLGAHVGGPRMAIVDDHMSFIDANVHSVDLIDFQYGPGNSWWHTAEDTLDKCSQESLAVIGRIVLAGLPALEAWVLR